VPRRMGVEPAGHVVLARPCSIGKRWCVSSSGGFWGWGGGQAHYRRKHTASRMSPERCGQGTLLIREPTHLQVATEVCLGPCGRAGTDLRRVQGKEEHQCHRGRPSG
jgi:hypothetical protein